MSTSEAERRREERRRRILANSEARMQKILGGTDRSTQDEEGLRQNDVQPKPRNWSIEDENWSDLGASIPDFARLSSAGDCPPMLQKILSEVPGLIASRDALATDYGNTDVSEADKTHHMETEPAEAKASSLKLSHHQALLTLISLLLTLLYREANFLLYLFMYEVVVYAYNLFSVPPFYDTSKSNMLLTAALLFGVPQDLRLRAQKVLMYFNWISADTAYFVCCTLVFHTAIYAYATVSRT